MDKELIALSEALGSACHRHQLTITTAESCTGGWAAQVITHTAGSSAWFERGFVTYSNAAKVDMLDILPSTLETYGAVSNQIAVEMAKGAITHSTADISLSITGIAGPSGGSPGKPVGTVSFAWCFKGQAAESEQCQFSGDRENIRRTAVTHGLQGLLDRIKQTERPPS